MPPEVLYGVISFLGLCVLTLGGLWVRAHDTHREWAVAKIVEQEKEVAVLKNNYNEIREDIREIKDTLRFHLDKEEKFQVALAAKLNLKLD